MALQEVTNRPGPGPKQRKQRLDARWMFDAALLSSPIDLTPLVKLSQTNPTALTDASGLLNRMVEVCLNSDKKRGVDKDTRLDVLRVCARCERARHRARRERKRCRSR